MSMERAGVMEKLKVLEDGFAQLTQLNKVEQTTFDCCAARESPGMRLEAVSLRWPGMTRRCVIEI